MYLLSLWFGDMPFSCSCNYLKIIIHLKYARYLTQQMAGEF